MNTKIYCKTAVMALAVFLFFGLSHKASAHGDGNITISDLGITDVGTLPSSKLYFLKEWSRGFQRFFTLNSFKKAELELRITNEKAAEALESFESNHDDLKGLARAIENYTLSAERLKNKFSNLKESSENSDVQKLIDKMNNLILKHSSFMYEVSEKLIIGDPDFDLLSKNLSNAQVKIGTILRHDTGDLEDGIKIVPPSNPVPENANR